MSGYLSSLHYSALANLLIGLGFGAGLFCLGVLFARGPFQGIKQSPLATLTLGTLVNSLIVQLTSMCRLGTKEFLAYYGWGLVIMGIGYLVKLTVKAYPGVPLIIEETRRHPLCTSIFLVGAVGSLISAIAPSIRWDETYYHMLVPARIVHDGFLCFYRVPLEAAVYPQMIYQIGLAPLHALEYVDAGNVVSWLIFIVFLGELFSMMGQIGSSRLTSWLIVDAIVCGGFTVTYYCTGGSFALGDSCLALAMARVLLLPREKIGQANFIFLQSILCIGAVSAKFFMIPVAGLLMLGSIYFHQKSKTPKESLLQVLVWSAFPWITLYLPLLIWTHYSSGSPYGPAFSGWFGSSIYDIHNALLQKNLPGGTWHGEGWSDRLRYAALEFSGCIWVSCLGLFTFYWLPSSPRIFFIVGLFLLQLVLLHTAILPEYRYLCGTQYACVIAVVWAVSRLPGLLPQRWLQIGLLACIPWTLLQLYYVAPRCGVVMGWESAQHYLAKHLRLYGIMAVIDKLMEPDAVLLTGELHWADIYFPRMIYHHPKDCPSGHPVYWIRTQEEKVPETMKLVFEDKHALFIAPYSGTLPPTYGTFELYRLATPE